MRRREFIRNMSAGAAGLAMSSLPIIRTARAQPGFPNILFILLEDTPDWFGCLGGHPDTLTPNIDELASRGVLFTNAHCASPICNPSRTALLTGRRPDTTGVYYNDDDWREFVGPEVITLPRFMRNQGFWDVRSGKVFHGTFDERDVWNQFFDGKNIYALAGHDPYNPGKPWNGLDYLMEGEEFFNWGATDCPEPLMADYRRVHFLNQMLLDGMREPFFMCYGTTKAHFPAIAPRRVLERFNPAQVALPPFNPNDLGDIPPSGLALIDSNNFEDVVGGKQWHRAVAAYLATIYYMDEMVGRLLNQFDSSPHANNTIIILAVDHGFHLGEKMHWRKATLWEESTHVLLSIYAPGVSQPNSVCHEAVSLLDIYPTLVDLIGFPPQDGLEGESLAPLLQTPGSSRITPAIVTLEAGNHAVIDETWHYIHYTNGDRELYNRINDPNQWNNLATDPQYEDIMTELASWIPVGGGNRPRMVILPH